MCSLGGSTTVPSLSKLRRTIASIRMADSTPQHAERILNPSPLPAQLKSIAMVVKGAAGRPSIAIGVECSNLIAARAEKQKANAMES